MKGELARRPIRLSALSAALILVLSIATSTPANIVSAQGQPVRNFVLIADGQERHLSIREGTVRDALRQYGINLGPKDEVAPGLNQPVEDGMRIRIVRVTEKVERTQESLPYKTIFKPVKGYRGGSAGVLVRGKPGIVQKCYLVTFKDGQPTDRKLVFQKVITKPVDQVVATSTSAALPSRGYFTGRKVLTMIATGYEPGPRSCGPRASGRTALGLRAGYGVVAVDPNYIPLGTRLYIEGYGYAVAADTGGAIKGNRIDLGHDSYREAVRVGRRKVIVHILD